MLVKRFFACLLALALLVGVLSGCAAKPSETAAEPMVLFTDSLGRKVGIPASLTRVAPSGAVASMFLAVVAPEYMSTINATPSSSQYRYLDPRLIDLPTTGQMYGSKSTLNLESILSSGAQVVIDIGDKKDNMAADLDALQRQIGIPVIFIEADLPHMAAAFRTLGSILEGKAERGEELPRKFRTANACPSSIRPARPASIRMRRARRRRRSWTLWAWKTRPWSRT